MIRSTPFAWYCCLSFLLHTGKILIILPFLCVEKYFESVIVVYFLFVFVVEQTKCIMYTHTTTGK